MNRPAGLVDFAVGYPGGLDILVDFNNALANKLIHITFGELAGLIVGELDNSFGVDGENSIRAAIKQSLEITTGSCRLFFHRSLPPIIPE